MAEPKPIQICGLESVYSEEELSGLEEAEDEWWAQGGRGRGGGCVPVL